jgi:tetratricopeptide (TPR) repeat protein
MGWKGRVTPALLAGGAEMNAVQYLRVAYKEVGQAREFLRDLPISMNLLLEDLEAAAKNVSIAREMDASASFTDESGLLQTCDTLAARIIDYEARAWEISIISDEQANFRSNMESGVAAPLQINNVVRPSTIREKLERVSVLAEKLCEYEPYNYQHYFQLAHAHKRLQHTKEALQAVERGLAVFPDEVELLKFKRDLEAAPPQSPPTAFQMWLKDNPDALFNILAFAAPILIFGGAICWLILWAATSEFINLGTLATALGGGAYFKFRRMCKDRGLP